MPPSILGRFDFVFMIIVFGRNNNTRYDLDLKILFLFLQIKNVLAPTSVDKSKAWKTCKLDLKKCTAAQLQTVQGMFYLPELMNKFG